MNLCRVNPSFSETHVSYEGRLHSSHLFLVLLNPNKFADMMDQCSGLWGFIGNPDLFRLYYKREQES